jgi:hypothetical protein
MIGTMRRLLVNAMATAIMTIAHGPEANSEWEGAMDAEGTFEVDITPQDDGAYTAGRMLIEKHYSGGLQARGIGQMISVRTASGHAVYYAVETVTGSLGEKSGSFVLLHEGAMWPDSQSLTVEVMEGAGSGDFKSLRGVMTITQDDDGHAYRFDYHF